MRDSLEETNLTPIFFPAWFLLNVALHYSETQHSPYWPVWGVFLNFHALRSDEYPSLGSSLNDVSPKGNFENKILDLTVRNDTLTMNINFLNYSCSIFVILKLPQYYMLNMLFQFIHFRDMWWKLHYDVNSFTTEIRKTDEGTF